MKLKFQSITKFYRYFLHDEFGGRDHDHISGLFRATDHDHITGLLRSTATDRFNKNDHKRLEYFMMIISFLVVITRSYPNEEYFHGLISVTLIYTTNSFT